MIRLKLPAEMSCDEEGCNMSIDARLILLATGTLGFAPLKGEAWQVQVQRGSPMTPYLTRCPKHSKNIIHSPEPKVIANAH